VNKILSRQTIKENKHAMFATLQKNTLPEYISNTMRNISSKSTLPQTITIFNIVVGSYMGENDITNPNPIYKRNHEFPQFVKNIFYNPEKQFSPQMQSCITHLDNLHINQSMILIDPMYVREQKYYGLQELLTKTQGINTQEHIMIHNDYKSTNICSNLDIVAIPDNISIEEINMLLTQITNYNTRGISTLINIMDCTSYFLRELYVTNTNPFIHIATPECLLCDDRPEYMPIITIDNPSAASNTLLVRWISYEKDYLELDTLKQVKDVCTNSLQTYNFIIANYRNRIANIDCIAIYKILGQLTITKTYTLESGKVISFNDLHYYTFHQLWRERGFSAMFVSNFDPYFNYNIMKYARNLAENENVISRWANHTLLEEVLISDVLQIIAKLNEYFPEIKINIKNHSRQSIRDVLQHICTICNVHI
jgi:hypothetical protein